jgi:hypothetical protein
MMVMLDEPHTTDAHSDLVDESLIDEMLRLSVEERLRHNDAVLRTVLELEEGLAAVRGSDRAAR